MGTASNFIIAVINHVQSYFDVKKAGIINHVHTYFDAKKAGHHFTAQQMLLAPQKQS